MLIRLRLYRYQLSSAREKVCHCQSYPDSPLEFWFSCWITLHQYSSTAGQPQYLLRRKEIFSLCHCSSPPGRGSRGDHPPTPPLQDKPGSWTANYSSVRCSVWITPLHTVPSVISRGVVQCRQLFPVLTSHLFRMSVWRWGLGLHVSDPREGLGVHPRSRPLFGLHIVQRVNTPAGLYT